MSSAADRRAAARCLFEDYDVPTAVIAKIGDWQQSSVLSWIEMYNWSAAPGIAALRAQFCQVYEALMARIDQESNSFSEHEKAARTLIAMGKALESLTVVDGKLKSQTPINDEGVGAGRETHETSESLNAENAERLNSELEALLERIASEESPTRSAANCP